MIKNTIIKSKFEHFLERTRQKLLEKSFDKLKENNWVIEERKETIEAILVKRNLKNAFNKMQNHSIIQEALKRILGISEKTITHQELLNSFGQWKMKSQEGSKKEQKILNLSMIIDRQKFKKQGYFQFKKRVQRLINIESKLHSLMEFRAKVSLSHYIQKWRKNFIQDEIKHTQLSSINYLLELNQQISKRNSFARWRQETQKKSINIQVSKQQSLYLIIKPLLRQRSKMLKQQAFNIYKQKVVMMNKASKYLRKLHIIHRSKSNLLILKALNKWRMTKVNQQKAESQKVMKISYLEENSANDSQNSVEKKKINSQDDNQHQTFEYDEDDNMEAFDQLNQIQQLSFETSNNQKLSIIDDEIEQITPLQFNTRRVSESYKNGKIENLRYL